MNFPSRVRSSITEEVLPGVGADDVRREAIRRLTGKGAGEFTAVDGVDRFQVGGGWRASSNPLGLASGGAVRVLAVPEGVRIDYRIDMPWFAYSVWGGAAFVVAAGLVALATQRLDPFPMIALIYGAGTVLSYGLKCSQANDLFKSALRRAKPAG